MFKSIKKLVKFAIVILLIYLAVQAFEYLFPVKYNETAEKYAKINNLELNLVYSIINAESSFDHNAVSKKGAEGLMQIKKDTAVWCLGQMGEPNAEFDLKDPETNIKIGTWYLSDLKNELGNENLAIIAYNAGISNVKKWLAEGTIDTYVTNPDNIPFEETKNYIKKVRFYKNVYKIIDKVTQFTDKIKIPGGII